MKIALVNSKFDLSGGAERYAVGLAEGLASLGHEVVAFGRRSGGLSDKVRFEKVGAVSLGRGLKTATFSMYASMKVSRERFDVIQGFGKSTCQQVHRTGGGVHRAFLERMGKTSFSLYDRIAAGIEDELFASDRLARVVCPSNWVAGEVLRYYPQIEERIRIIPNGVDCSTFKAEGREESAAGVRAELSIPADAPLIAFAATNFPLKGFGDVVEVLGGLGEAHLLALGGGDPAPFAEPIKAAGAEGRIHYGGMVAGEELARFYRAADVLVHPTRYDPFANVCLEALACGTPVVTSDSNGAADVLAGGGGEAVPLSEGPGAIAEAVERQLSLGEEGRAAALKTGRENDRPLHVARVEALYKEVLAEEGA